MARDRSRAGSRKAGDRVLQDLVESGRMSDEEYAIAIVGGATAGAEAADIFAKHGILTVVFEQNARPYGKVEDGLPKWHVALRQKEYRTIDTKLSQEHVHFVPCTELGRDVSLRDLTDTWGFHSVVLANGAWRDRPLPVEGADEYVGRGLVYQNPFIMWFNHRHEAAYDGEVFEVVDGAAVVGGGLASIDVVKVINLELTIAALAERGIETNLVELEVKGIPKTLAGHGLTWDDLGVDGCTLYYRRRPDDMPLVTMPDKAPDKVREKIERVAHACSERPWRSTCSRSRRCCRPQSSLWRTTGWSDCALRRPVSRVVA